MAVQILAGTAIIHNKSLLLLKQRKDGDQADKWGPPAGHGEGKESALETAIRETKEETNLDVEILGMAQCGILSHKGMDYALVLYVAKPKNLKLFKKQEAEVADHAWVSLKDLKTDKYPLRKKFLKEPLMQALTKKLLPIDSFKIYSVEED